MPIVEIVPAGPEDASIFANMMQLYTHDFSAFWAGRARGELGSDGRFESYPLEPYWSAPNHVALLVRMNGHLIGFALVNDAAHSGRPVERNMAEFFIVRKHRRSGAGTAAALGVFARYPGLWEIAVARANTGAYAFWKRVLEAAAPRGGLEEFDSATSTWDGPIIRATLADGRISR